MRLVAVLAVALLSIAAVAVVLMNGDESRIDDSAALSSLAATRSSGVAPSRSSVSTEYHVAPTGDDEGPGTADEPFATLEHAVAAVPPGSIIRLTAGSFQGTEIRRSDLTLRGAPGHLSVIQGPLELRGSHDIAIHGLVIEGVTKAYRAGLSINDSERIRVVDNLVRGNSFGIYLADVADVVIEDNEVTDNAFGIEVHHGAAGTVIRDNHIHDNNRELDDSRRRGGVNFYYTTGGVTLVDNRLIDNLSVGVEIFGASDLLIMGNEMTGSADLIETGTGDGTPCSNLTIIRNVAYNSTRRDGDERGFYLRCAAESLVAHNTFDGLDKFAIGVNDEAPNFGGTVDGLRIVNNILANGRGLSIDSPLPSDVVIDHNLVWPSPDARHGDQVAFYGPIGRGTSDSAQFHEWSGYQEHGILADPLFVARDERDYRLRAGSAAINAGVPLDVSNDIATDGRPDLGRHEFGGAHSE